MRQIKLCPLLAVSLAVFALAIIVVPPAIAQENLLRNADLTQGAGNSPLAWHAQSWRMGHDPSYSSPLQWLSDQQPPELEVWNLRPDDARWVQTLQLDPGWYHFTASVRTEDVSRSGGGANISILEGWAVSPSVTGTTGWRQVGFYLDVKGGPATITLACRLGEYATLVTGKAFFRDIRATAVDTPPSGGDPKFTFQPYS